MIGLVVAVAVAAPVDPLLAGAELPEGADVRIDRGDPMWTITIDGRAVLVPTPRTPADEDVVRAVVISLLSGLDLVPTAPLPPPTPPPLPTPPPTPTVVRAERTAEPPPPAPPPAPQPVTVMILPVLTTAPAPAPQDLPAEPVVIERSPPPSTPLLAAGPPLVGWAAAEVVVRPGMSPGAGGAAGVWFGRRGGAGLRLAGRLPRIATVGGPSSVLELDADVEVWGSVIPSLTWVVGGGAAVRRYAVEELEIATNVVPRAAAGVLVPVDTRPVTLAFGLALELDLGVTRIGQVGAHEVLPPAALRLETRIAPPRERR